MLKRVTVLFFGAVAFSGALISCSSNQLKISEAEIQQYRGPASVFDEADQKFQLLMQNASNSAKAKISLIDKFLQIQNRTEGEVEVFEKELDTAVGRRKSDPNYSYTLQASPSYSNLMQLRYMLDREIDGITHIYERLMQTVTDVRLPIALRKTAVKAVNDFHAKLKSLDGANRLQSLELIDSIAQIHNSFKGAALPKVKNDRMPASTEVSWSEVEKSFAPFNKPDSSKLRAKYQKEIHKHAVAAMASKEFALEPLPEPVAQSDRAPSSEKYAPGVGTYGNVTGYSFPPGHFVITYDDGPRPGSSERIWALLKENNTPATLFELTKNALAYPNLVAQAKAQNLPINSHSWTHPDLTKQSSATLDKEINQAVQVLRDKVGVQPVLGTANYRFFRCPYGACYAPASPAIRARIANLNLIHAYWAIDSLDWHYPKDPDRVFGLVTKGMLATGRGVILMHDIHDGTVEVTRKLLAWAKVQNQATNKIKFSTLEDAVDSFNATVNP